LVVLIHEEKERINSTLESGIASYAMFFLSFSYSQGISHTWILQRFCMLRTLFEVEKL